MKGDFTRMTFDAARHFSRVLRQQGRVTIDADANEQTEILLHYLRTLAVDVIGRYGGPEVGLGFALGADADGKLTIGSGRYYVDGILVENERTCLYTRQPHYPVPGDDPLLAEMTDADGHTLCVYLDVWERHITHLDVPAIRDVALGGPDTSSRSQVVWQVRAEMVDSPQPPATVADLDCAVPLNDLVSISAAALAARVSPGDQSSDPGVLSPAAKYRGSENHFYRVEIHAPGKAGAATFKWSRDNGSVVTAWLGTKDNDLVVADSSRFSSGTWVELIDESKELLGLPGTLVKVSSVAGQILSIDPASVPSANALAWSAAMVSPKVRRWDHVQHHGVILQEGAPPIVESTTTHAEWLDLEHGVQVHFSAGGAYRTGDYWTIPARVSTGSIEWPEQAAGVPALLEPFGIEHHFAPLGFVRWDRKKLHVHSCLCSFTLLGHRAQPR